MATEVTTGIDLSELPDNLKKHVREEGSPILERLMISDQAFLDYMQLYDGVTDELPLTEMFIDSILQPGNKDEFKAKGKVGFKPRVGKVRPCKVDMTFKPTQLKSLFQSYLGKIKKSKAGDIYELSFEEEIVSLIVRRVKNDIRLKALFEGKYNADGESAEDTMQGILRILAKDFVQKNIFNGAPITNANAIDQVRGVMKLVDDEYLQEDLVCLLSPRNEMNYWEDYQVTHGSLPYNTQFKKKTIDGTNIEIVSEPGLAGTDAVIIVPRNNIAWLTNSIAKQDSIIVEKEKRNLHILMDFDAAPEVALMGTVWGNDAISEWVEADDTRIAAAQ